MNTLNNNRWKPVLLALLIALTISFSSSYNLEGSGSSSNPYKIDTCGDLQAIQNDLDANYTLESDVDCYMTEKWNNGEGFKPIGGTFTGTLYGNGHTISNVYIDNVTSGPEAIFSSMDGEVRNLTINSSTVKGGGGPYSVVGTLAGNLGGTINYVTVEDSYVKAEKQRAGGIVAKVEGNGEVLNSRVESSKIKGGPGDGYQVGGIAGWSRASGSKIVNSSVDTNTTVIGDRDVGGLLGKNAWLTRVENSYSLARVEGGGSSAGGLIGTLGTSGEQEVINSYAAGNVTSSSGGGLIGEDNSGSETVENSYWDINATGQETSANGTGLNTTEMYNKTNYNNWDFQKQWAINPGNNYPVLMEGEGTSENPFKLSTCRQLEAVSNNLTAHYVLTSDIDCSMTENWHDGKGFDPIDGSFSGVFEGKGYEITDLEINRGSTNEVGLFKVIGGEVNNLEISANVTGSSRTGILAGNVDGGTVAEVHTSGKVKGNGFDVGGLAGRKKQGIIKKSSSSAEVTGDTEVGGLLGSNRGLLNNSFSTGNVSSGDTAGGLVSSNGFDGEIYFSYTISNVSGSSTGGLVNNNENSASAISNSYWDVNTTNQSSSAGGTGLYTSEMKNSSNFQNWDFKYTWGIDEGRTYPFFTPGNGTEQNPFKISNVDQLQEMENNLTAHYELVDDIDASNTSNWNSGKGWEPIGNSTAGFNGTLDGSNHEIRKLFIQRTSVYGVALTRAITDNALISNITFVDAYVKGDTAPAILAGTLDGKAKNIYVTGSTVSGEGGVGGIAGAVSSNGFIKNVIVEADIYDDSERNDGGVAGIGLAGSRIENAVSGSNVDYDGYASAGVLMGQSRGLVNNTYAYGSISTGDVGGLIGRGSGGASVTIDASYSTSEVSGESSGGLLGRGYGVENGYWDINTSGKKTSEAGTGLYTSQLKANESLKGFDFGNVWELDETKNQGYPYLQNVPVIPRIYDYRVERLSGNDANVSFRVGQELDDIKVEVEGPTAVNLTEANFTSRYNSTLYWAEVNGSSAGEYNATIKKAVSGANGLDGADEEFEETLCDQGTKATDCQVQNHKTVEEMPYQAEEINISGNLTIQDGGKLEYDKNLEGFGLEADNIEIMDGGEIRGNVNITTDNLTLQDGGVIDATGLGYRGKANGGPNGPGAGSGFYSSGGYGGRGGNGYQGGGGGVAYGNFKKPLSFGSGGDWSNSGSGGANGGGRIIVNVTSLDNSGTIESDGQTISSGGSGSGGSILIDVENFYGSGNISAEGSTNNGGSAGSGAGGRIALIGDYRYNGEITVRSSGQANSGAKGNPGTIYPRNTICDSGNLSSNSDCTLTEIHENSVQNFTGENLTVTSGAALKGGQDLTLNFSHITVEEDANITATKHMEVNAESMDVKGKIDVTARPDPDYSDTNRYLDLNVADLDVSGGLRANVNVSSDNFTLAENGWLNASGLGYNGPTTLNGVSGPGGGIWERNENNNVGAGSGAGYGGKGGLQQRAAKPGLAGGKYGSLRLPYSFGSAGAPSWGDKGNNDGGGRLIVTSKYAKLEGSFSANGRDAYPSCWTSGGGAGGSILINISSTLGGFSLYSTGGNSQTGCVERGGGGAGGRVAVYTDSDPSKYSLSINVSGGSGYEDGGDGTVRTPLDVSLDKTTVKDGEDLEINGGLATDVDGVLKGHPLQVWVEGNRRNLSDWGSGAPNLSLAEGLDLKDHADFSDFDKDGRTEAVYIPNEFSGDGNDIVREWNGSEWVQNDSQDKGLDEGIDSRAYVDVSLNDFDHDDRMNALFVTKNGNNVTSKEWNGTDWESKPGLVDELNTNYLTAGRPRASISVADFDGDNKAEMLYDSDTGNFDSGTGFQWTGSKWERNNSLMNGISPGLGDEGKRGFDIEDFDGDGSYELFNPTSSGVDTYRWNGSHWNSVDVARGLDRISSVGGTNIVDFGENGRVEAIVPSNPDYAVTWRQPFTNSSGEFSYSFTPKKAGNISLKFNSSNGTKVAGEGTEYYVKDELKLENNQSQFVSEDGNYIDVDETDSNTEVNLSTKIYENVDSQIDWVKADVTSPDGTQETFTLCQNLGETQTCSQEVNLEDLDDSSIVEKGRYNVTYRARSSLDGSNIFEGKDYGSSFYVQNVSMPLDNPSVVDPAEILKLNGTVYSEPSDSTIGDTGIGIFVNGEEEDWRWMREKSLVAGLDRYLDGGLDIDDIESDSQPELYSTREDFSYEWNGTGWSEGDILKGFNPSENPPRSAVYDINGDGRLDIISEARKANLDGATWNGSGWEENDALAIGKFISPKPSSTNQDFDIADFDSDGQPELIKGRHLGNRELKAKQWEGYWKENQSLKSGIDESVSNTPMNLFDVDRDSDIELFHGQRDGNIRTYDWTGSKWSENEIADSIPDVGSYSDISLGNIDDDSKIEAIISSGDFRTTTNNYYGFIYTKPVTSASGKWNYNLSAPSRAGTYNLAINTTDQNGIYGENFTTFNVTLPIEQQRAEFEASNNSHIDVDSSNQNVNLSAFVGNSSDSNVDKTWAEVESPEGSTETFFLGSTEAKSNSQTWFKSVDVSSYFTNNGHTTLGRYNISFYANTSRGIGSEVKNTSFYVENVSIEAELGDSRVNLNEELNVSGDVELGPYGDSIGANPVNLQISNSTWNRSIQQSDTLEWETASDWDNLNGEDGVVHSEFGDNSNKSVSLGYKRNTEDLVGYWSLDEVVEGGAEDHTKYDNSGTLEGTPNPGPIETDEKGLFNSSAYQFDGSDDYVEVPVSGQPAFDVNGSELTFMLWFNGTVSGGNYDLAGNLRGCGGLGTEGYGLDVGYSSLSFTAADGSECSSVGGVGVSDDELYHIVGVFNGSDMKLFKNGELISSKSVSIDRIEESDDAFRIGESPAGGGFFDGVIDEVRVYNRSLSDSEIKDLYNTAFNGSLTTSYESTQEKTTELGLRNLNYSLNNGSINVTVQSDFDSDGTVEENASEVSLDGGESFEVSGISEESDRFRLFIELESDNVTKSPVFSGVELVAGEVSNSSGIYEKSFEAPPEPGNYTVKVNSTDENGVYGVNETTLSVFNLTARIDDYPDAVFKDADDTEDYTIYDTIISDPENPGTLEDIYYSFYDPQNWDIEYQVGQNSFNQDFTTVTSLGPGETYSLNASIDIGENAELGPQEVILNASSSDNITSETALKKKYLDGEPGDRLVGFWRFDNEEGAVEDYSGGSNDGSADSDVVRGAEGKFRSDAFEVGDSNGVTVPYNDSLNFSDGDMAFSLWLYLDSTSDNQQEFFSNDNDFNNGISQCQYFFGDVRCRINDGGSYSTIRGDSLDKNKWTHIVFSINGTQARIYQNGSLTASKNLGNGLGAADDPLRLGHGLAGDARMDEVRLYDDPLNQEEVDELFNPLGTSVEVWTRSEADFVAPDVRSPIPRNNTYWQVNAEIYDEYESSGGPRGGTLEDVNTTFGLYQVTDTGDQLKTRKYVDSDSNGVAEFNWSLNRFGVGEYYVRAITKDEPGLYVNSTNAPVFTQSFNVSGIFIRDSSLQNYDSIYRENGSSPDDGGFQATFSNSLDNYVENANISWSFPDQELNTTTDSNGFARVVYNPSTSVTPGNYSVEIDAEKKNYEPFGFNQSVVVRGKLNVTNEYTEGTRRPLTRGLETVLNSSVVDEYSSSVSADVNWSINGTVIDSGIDTIDFTNESIFRGNATLWANASEKYYDSDQDSEKVKVYGLAEVSELYPPDTDILPGTTINVNANVTDAVTNETVKDMPVTFYENGTEIGSSLTNSSGVAKIQWSPSDGYKNLTAEIKDNSSILYNVSDYNTSSMVEIDRELYIEEYSFSERTIFRPNTLEPYISDLDVEVTETDTDSSRKPASGKTIYAEVNDSDTFSCVTDSTGSCTISIEPGQSIDPGNDTVEIISNTTGYQSDFKQDWLIVKGSFTTFDGQHEIVEPASGEATRGESLNIEFAMKNSFGETVDLPVNWKFAGRNITDTAKDTSFTVGVEESLGSQTLSADVISPYYYEGADSDSVSIDVYGKSNVKLERPSNDTTVGYGESPEVLCSVDDQNGDAINSYPVRFFQNETTLKNTTTDIRGEATAEWEVPNRIEEYEVGCEISDNASKYFRADTGVSSKLYETNDDVPPTVGNLSLNVTELKPGESVFVNYTASDQVGVDDTYIEITDPIFSTTRIEPSNVSGTFEAVFTPQKTGSYTVEAFANDTNGNLGSDTVNFQTAQSATVSLDPSDFSAGDVRINQNQTYSTDVTVDAENDVEYLNLSFNVSNDYEPLVDYNSSALSCGNLSSGESCSKTMSVTVEEGVPPQTAFIQYVADYYANGTERSVRAVQTLSVQENPVITPDPGELFNNGAGGGLTPANNSYNNTVDVENVGNYEVLEFGTSFSSSNISQDQIEFYGGQVREIPSSSSQAERTQEVTAEFTAPYGLSPGNYSANISFQGEQTSGKTEVTYLIDDFVDLRAGPKGEESTLVVGQQQKIGEVEIKSLANTRIDVVPSVDSGLSTNSIETNLQGLPNNIQLDPLENDTFAVMTDSDGIPTTVDDASLVIDFEVPADGLTVQQGATFNIQVANLSLNFLSNTSTEDVDIKQASQDSVQVEYSKAGSASTQNVSFDVFLRNSSRNISKEANILGRASQDGEFTLDFSYPSAEDARVYDLVIETTDQELGVSFNTTVKKKYRYIDVTKPVYKSVKVEDVFKDEKVDVNVSVSDNNLKPVRNVSYQVEFPSDSKRFYLNKTGGYWTGRFSPPNSTGDYLGTFRTTDNAFNNASFEKYFRVGEKKNFTGRFEDSGGNPVSASISLTDPESGNLISSFDIPESSQYSFDVKSGRYDVVVNTQGSRVVLNNADVTKDDPIKINSLSGSEAPSPASKGKLMGIAVKQNMDPSSGEIMFNYSQYESNIPSDESISDVEIGRCEQFNYTNIECNGNWTKLNRTAFTTNVNQKTVTASVPGFSIYTLYFPEETNEELQEIRDEVEQTQRSLGGISRNISDLRNGSGQGGGSGGSGLSLGSNSISASIKPGETKRASLLLQNQDETDREYSFSSSEAISRFLSLPDEQDLSGEESTEAIIEISAPSDATPSSYSGYITIESDESQRQLPVNIEILPPESELLDLSIEPVFDSIRPGSNAQVEATLNNQGYTRNVDVTLNLEVVNPDTNQTLATKETTLAVSTTLTRVVNIQIPEDAKLRSYEVRGTARYSNLDVPQVATSIATLEVSQPFWGRTVLGVTYGTMVIGFVAMLITAIAAAGIYQYHRKQVLKKKRYMEQIDLDTIPSGGQRKAYVGKLAEMGTRTFIDLDDLTTHALIAGATGSGKTVTGQIMVEEALEEGVNVIVLDPTAQWSGYLRECDEDEMIELYSEFGMSESDARTFNGNIRAVEPEQPEVDIGQYLESEEKEGRIIVFSMHKLDNENLEKFVDSTIQQVFDANLPERNHLETMLVYDEAHRILDKFGGSGEGVEQLERGAREFRKWGVGMLLLSQVVSDFPGEVRANVGTTVQMRTQYEGDLDRIKEKFGMDTVQSVAKAEVGSGMVQNSDYNHGRPYFVNFRPMLHSPHRLSDEQLDTYEDYNRRMDQLEKDIDELEEQGQEVYEYRNQLKLARKNLRKGSFNLVDIYIEELEEDLE